MWIVRVILAAGFGGCFGYGISRLFQGCRNEGLGVLAIGVVFAVFYIVLWIIETK